MTHEPRGKHWRAMLERFTPLPLVAAHDALTAKLIERAGFPAYQIGGFAIAGARHAWPDIDLAQMGEHVAATRDIMAATSLPVLIDGDDGYGDSKNVTHTIRAYEAMGASAIFIEDQIAPKKCGHMGKAEVVEKKVMVHKIKAACAARSSKDSMFLLARTDARGSNGVKDAIKRCETYFEAGADGVYVEAVHSVDEMEQVGKALGKMPLATTILEGGGKTPWVAPADMYRMGFAMVLYPTSVLFRVTRAIERALDDLRAGRPMPKDDAVDMETFEKIVGLDDWRKIEETFDGRER